MSGGGPGPKGRVRRRKDGDRGGTAGTDSNSWWPKSEFIEAEKTFAKDLTTQFPLMFTSELGQREAWMGPSGLVSGESCGPNSNPGSV